MSTSEFSLSACSRRAFFGLLTAAAALPGRLAGQASENEATFSTDVRVINVFATVRDKQGKIVSTLTKEDFTLSEDGRNQEIRYFARESDLPLTLGLLVDTSLSQRRVLGEEKSASFRFLDKVLRADKDRTFVIHFDRETELLQDLTSSRADLQRALDQLELPADQRPQMSRSGGSGGNGGGFPGGGGHQGAGTTLYDAILLASDEIMKKQTGRKALILLTDGVDQGSKTFLNDAIRAAQKDDTLVYSILFADDQAYQQGFGGLGRGVGMGGGGRDGKKVLQQISRETGGTFFEVSKKFSLDQIYDQLQEELRNQYSLGYTPDGAGAAAGYRTIKVAVRKPGLTVQSREGYYPTGV